MTTPATSIRQLVELVESQANVIVATGTGQGRFDDFDADYQRNDRQLVAKSPATAAAVMVTPNSSVRQMP